MGRIGKTLCALENISFVFRRETQEKTKLVLLYFYFFSEINNKLLKHFLFFLFFLSFSLSFLFVFNSPLNPYFLLVSGREQAWGTHTFSPV